MIGRGNIIAATFINQGSTFTAILDDNTGNYYDQNGRAMKKAFLRSPLDFRRVSSNFNPRRLHPVTGQIKAHRGTDYVAPVGTPIWLRVMVWLRNPAITNLMVTMSTFAIAIPTLPSTYIYSAA